jgi:hypothetical protein
MEITSLQKYPTPEGRPPEDAAGRRQSLLTTHLIRFALVLAILGADRWALAKVEREREAERVYEAERARLVRLGRDPVWVYERLAYRYDFDELKTWCGLTVTLATADEVARLEAAAQAADPRDAMCDPYAKKDAVTWRRVWLISGLEWYKLQSPTDPDRWVGIAVKQRWFSGWSPRWIWCRVRVGI